MKQHRAFTIIELLVVIAIIALLVSILVPVLGKARVLSRQMKDSTQVRSIVQAMLIWANTNRSQYPLPSALESVAGPTTDQVGDQKNTTSNIFSIMIFNGFIAPEICISPAESNTLNVQRYDNYSNPTGAVTSTGALWDPKFHGVPSTGAQGYFPTDPYLAQGMGGIGNQSYAHCIPFGKRRNQWSGTYITTEVVLGNRGPTYNGTSSDGAAWAAGTGSTGRWVPLPSAPSGQPSGGADSFTLLIHGSPKTWEGNIGHNDCHITFETKPNPPTLPYLRSGTLTPRTTVDNVFVNETDQAGGDSSGTTIRSGTNAYLRAYASVTAATNGDVSYAQRWRD